LVASGLAVRLVRRAARWREIRCPQRFAGP
jgi:hypothetical protein